MIGFIETKWNDSQPFFVRCDQRSEVAADYDSIRLEKNHGWMVCVCMYRVIQRNKGILNFYNSETDKTI